MQIYLYMQTFETHEYMVTLKFASTDEDEDI